MLLYFEHFSKKMSLLGISISHWGSTIQCLQKYVNIQLFLFKWFSRLAWIRLNTKLLIHIQFLFCTCFKDRLWLFWVKDEKNRTMRFLEKRFSRFSRLIIQLFLKMAQDVNSNSWLNFFLSLMLCTVPFFFQIEKIDLNEILHLKIYIFVFSWVIMWRTCFMRKVRCMSLKAEENWPVKLKKHNFFSWYHAQKRLLS